MYNELIIDQTTMQATGIQVRIGVRIASPAIPPREHEVELTEPCWNQRGGATFVLLEPNRISGYGWHNRH